MGPPRYPRVVESGDSQTRELKRGATGWVGTGVAPGARAGHVGGRRPELPLCGGFGRGAAAYGPPPAAQLLFPVARTGAPPVW